MGAKRNQLLLAADEASWKGDTDSFKIHSNVLLGISIFSPKNITSLTL